MLQEATNKIQDAFASRGRNLKEGSTQQLEHSVICSYLKRIGSECLARYLEAENEVKKLNLRLINLEHKSTVFDEPAFAMSASFGTRNHMNECNGDKGQQYEARL